MTLHITPYLEQLQSWPKTGRHILSQHDQDTILVYQAYRPAIAEYALEHQRFGGEFSFNRMSWIKPNFLWMMFRCGWATKAGQECVLGIRLSRLFFEHLLSNSVSSSFNSDSYSSPEAWKTDLGTSQVRLQWDPDHSPTGQKVERRAIQLGIRGDLLREFGERQPLEIINLTPFVAEQRLNCSPSKYSKLLMPSETVYSPLSYRVAERIKLDSWRP